MGVSDGESHNVRYICIEGKFPLLYKLQYAGGGKRFGDGCYTQHIIPLPWFLTLKISVSECLVIDHLAILDSDNSETYCFVPAYNLLKITAGSLFTGLSARDHYQCHNSP